VSNKYPPPTPGVSSPTATIPPQFPGGSPHSAKGMARLLCFNEDSMNCKFIDSWLGTVTADPSSSLTPPYGPLPRRAIFFAGREGCWPSGWSASFPRGTGDGR